MSARDGRRGERRDVRAIRGEGRRVAKAPAAMASYAAHPTSLSPSLILAHKTGAMVLVALDIYDEGAIDADVNDRRLFVSETAIAK